VLRLRRFVLPRIASSFSVKISSSSIPLSNVQWKWEDLNRKLMLSVLLLPDAPLFWTLFWAAAFEVAGFGNNSPFTSWKQIPPSTGVLFDCAPAGISSVTSGREGALDASQHMWMSIWPPTFIPTTQMALPRDFVTMDLIQQLSRGYDIQIGI
jgi:hypothetical protein